MTLLFKLAALLLVAASCIKLLVLYYEHNMVFFPIKQIMRTPRDESIAYSTQIFLTPDGYELSGWWIPHPLSKGTILFFHGNAGNISDRVDNLALLYRNGLSVFIFDYRGYGQSEGSPSETGVYLDGDAAFEHITTRLNIPAGQITFFGRSLGAAVAAHTARGRPIRGLILENAFPSAYAMGEIILPWVPMLKPFMNVRLETANHAGRRICPLLQIHGTDDEVVPFAVGQELFASQKDPKAFLTVEGGIHGDCFLRGGQPYFDRIVKFASEGLL